MNHFSKLREKQQTRKQTEVKNNSATCKSLHRCSVFLPAPALAEKPWWQYCGGKGQIQRGKIGHSHGEMDVSLFTFASKHLSRILCIQCYQFLPFFFLKLHWFLVFVCFETGSPISQASLELRSWISVLPVPSRCWDHRDIPPFVVMWCGGWKPGLLGY